MLRTENLRVAIGGHPIVHKISLEVPMGKLCGLVGPNGSGKTTFLRAATRLISYDGQVFYGDHNVADLDERQRASLRAYIPQNNFVGLPFSVEQIVAQGWAHRDRFFSTHVPTSKMEEALSAVGYRGSLAQPFRDLSGGEQQLILVARALLQEARLFLLDEPTSHLDIKHCVQIISVLKKRLQQGASALLSIHDLNLAYTVCDYLFLFHRGHLLKEGSPQEVLTRTTLQEVYGVQVNGESMAQGGPIHFANLTV